jgi:hypothetical protein
VYYDNSLRNQECTHHERRCRLRASHARVAFVGAILSAVASVSVAQAQSNASGNGAGNGHGRDQAEISTRVALVIAPDETHGPTAPLRILRQKKHGDVIIVSPTTSASELSDAIMTVLVAREIGGDTTSSDQEIRPSRGSVPAGWKNAFGGQSQRILALLPSEPPTEIGNLGAMPSRASTEGFGVTEVPAAPEPPNAAA